MGIIDKGGNIALPAKVPWYEYTVHPAVRYIHWAARHLQKIPPDWRPYYRRLLANEIRASIHLNTSWDVFMAVAEGYRKSKWILQKYGQVPEAGSIPHPYDDFWKSTTHEERVWAHRRSYQLKELQAIQRDDQDVYGGVRMDRNHATIDVVSKMMNGKSQNGNTVHSMDLPAPKESDIREDETMTHMLMASVEDDRMWNPALKAREYREKLESADDLMKFEDEDEDDDEGEAPPPPQK